MSCIRGVGGLTVVPIEQGFESRRQSQPRPRLELPQLSVGRGRMSFL
jgi:hypothetical protein